MDEEAIKLLATVYSLKLLVGRLYSLVYTIGKFSPEVILKAHETLEQKLPTLSLVQTEDPALSDLLSSEIESQIKTMLLGIERELEIQRK